MEQVKHAKQQQCSENRKPHFIAAKFRHSRMDISFRADVHALLTLETVAAYIPAAVLRQGQIRRAYLFTGSTAFGAFFPFAPHREKRQNGQQGENSTHRTQETAEETLTEYHSHQDQHQQNAAQPICAHFEVSGAQHGEHIPGTPACKISVNAQKAQQNHCKQDCVFQIGKRLFPALFQQERFLLDRKSVV